MMPRVTTMLLLAVALAPPASGQVARPAASALTIGRLHYEGGGDWYANPTSLPNLLAAIEERTALPTAGAERVVRHRLAATEGSS